jgi:uncharacterized membrane protein YhiD involved in acid resistance
VIAGSDVVIRIALALAFGAAIGIEREWRQKHAGLKTMTLVSLGAAGFAIMSDTFGPLNHNPAQIAAAVVGGIGFIGAGVIMHRGATVQGVTTAATLWADASVGVAVGLGHYMLGIVLTSGIVIVQLMFRRIEGVIRRDVPARFELRVECVSDTLHEVIESVAHAGLPTLRTSVQRGAEHITLRTIFRGSGPIDVTKLQEQLVALGGVRRVDVRYLGVEED